MGEHIERRRFRLPDAIPPLRGWAATLYVAVWLPMLALTLVGICGGAWHRAQEGAGEAYSWHALGLSTGDGLIDRVAGGEARAAGVRPGDRVLAIDGIAIPSGATPDELEGRVKMHLLQANGPVRLIIQANQSRPRAVTLTRSVAHGETLYTGTGLTPTSLSRLSALMGLIGPASLLIGAGLLFGRRRDSVAALLSFSLLGVASNSSWAWNFWHPLGADWIYMTLGTLGTLGMLLTMLVFPNGRFVPRWTIWMVPAAPALQLLSWAEPASSSWILPTFLLLAIIAMFVRYRRQTPGERRQWRWALIGFVLGVALLLGPGSLYWHYLGNHEHAFGASLWSWILTPAIFQLSFMVVAAGVVLSVLRYRLYDTQAAVSRSILYGALTLALLAIFAGSEKIVEMAGEAWFGSSMGALAGVLGTALAATAIAPLHERIGRWVEHRFQKNLIHLRHDLPPLLAALGETSSPQEVAETLLDRLGRGLHITRGAIIADGRVIAAQGIAPADVETWQAGITPNPHRGLEIHKRDPLFPVRALLAHGQWLALGPRPDDSLYGKDERELLIELTTPIAHALRVARDRTRREADVATRFDLIERELSALRAALNPAIPAVVQLQRVGHPSADAG